MTAAAANGDDSKQFPFQFDGKVTYDTPEDADMVCKTLAVDAETVTGQRLPAVSPGTLQGPKLDGRVLSLQLRPEQVERKLTTDGRDFVMHFQAVDARTLRAAVGTFCDLLALATRSIEMFGSTRKQ